MYSLPQEIEVWYIIPSIRKELAKILTKKHSMTFEKTGRILGVSKSAVSQYLSNKRAGKMEFPEQIKKEIVKSADIIAKNDKKAVIEIEKILQIIKSGKCSCDLCKKYNSEILNYCESVCK